MWNILRVELNELIYMLSCHNCGEEGEQGEIALEHIHLECGTIDNIDDCFIILEYECLKCGYMNTEYFRFFKSEAITKEERDRREEEMEKKSEEEIIEKSKDLLRF